MNRTGYRRVLSTFQGRAMNVIKALFASVVVLCCCSMPLCAFEIGLRDGAYEGEYSFVKVRVTVAGGKVERIEMVEHGGGGEKYALMAEPLLSEMVEKQGTSVDSVTGATVSSENLKKAVEAALEKAR